jgi:hypothetical protein
MTGNSRLIAPGCPSAIPVHYYRDMSRKPVGIDLAQKKLIAGAMFYYFGEFVEDISAHYPGSNRLHAP